jgi:hypothetical protein
MQSLIIIFKLLFVSDYIIILTRFVYTVAFVLNIVASILSLFLCCGPDQALFLRRVGQVGLIVLAAGTEYKFMNIWIKKNNNNLEFFQVYVQPLP